MIRLNCSEIKLSFFWDHVDHLAERAVAAVAADCSCVSGLYERKLFLRVPGFASVRVVNLSESMIGWDNLTDVDGIDFDHPCSGKLQIDEGFNIRLCDLVWEPGDMLDELDML
tara:strand:+ start:385 stop:723 length:339 start_codon:yes stop_codon:yes gene_type:complete